jgi:UDP-N-acetylglucosamine 4,6-dehydratase
MEKYFKNKKILITGGTGSIGSSIVKKLLEYKCNTIRVLGSDENGLHNLSLQLGENSNFFDSMKKNRIRYMYGDITDQDRMLTSCEDVNIIIHAAAMKHVPICEYNPFEATKVNVIGTQNIIKAALAQKVEKFILISTDKVVDPTTCLGATKLLAEKISINSNLIKGKKKTIFSVVRFGNVIGTRGSVLPKFIYQLKNNENITLSDKYSTRFFVTVKDSVKSIFDAILLMKGGEVFIPKTINAIKISDLAHSLSNYYSESKSKIVFTGLRSGEKIHEKIITVNEHSKLKYTKNLFVIDSHNTQKLKKITNKINYFDSSKANLLNQHEIIKYLEKNLLIKKVN